MDENSNFKELIQGHYKSQFTIESKDVAISLNINKSAPILSYHRYYMILRIR